jgi:hypothetical protein
MIKSNMKISSYFTFSKFKFTKKDIYFYFLLIFYVFSLFYIKEMIFLSYNTSDSPDFMFYFTFLEFNFDVFNQPQSEQGFIFYDLHSYYFYLRNFNFMSETFFIYMSKSVQEVNFILFLTGSLGIYQLLKIFKYNKIQILTSVILINFLPISVAQRMVFKPEIFAFALIPWLVISLEKFIITKKIKYLFVAISFFVSLVTQKGSIFAMVSVFIFIFYFPRIFVHINKKNINFFFLLLIITFSTLLLTVTENSDLNNRGFFDLQSGAQSEEKYNNKASVDLIYKFNPEKMFFYPYKHLHNQSAIHITLLDSFGDYFDLYWGNDASNFYKLRHDLFVFEKSEIFKLPKINFENKEIKVFVQDEKPNYFIRKTTSAIVASVFFYFFLTFFQKSDKNKKKFFLMPFIGYLILSIHVITGFPENNFDPKIGDSLKPFYYSFFIIIAFSFTISELVKNKLRSILALLLLIPVFLYIFGFPRQIENITASDIQQVNIFSEFCNLNKFIFNLEMKDDCQIFDTEKIKNNEYENFKSFTKKPNFHLVNFLLIVANLIGISYLQIHEYKLSFLRTIKKRI